MTRFVPLVLALLAALTSQSALAQQPAVPTILISIDGFRPDYLGSGNTPHLDALAARGTIAEMRPSFPTKTFPNHTAMITGRIPDHSGIVSNNMIDPMRPGKSFSLGDARQALDAFWWDQVEPLWVTAEKAGVRAATMFWPGSEVAIRGVRPQDWARYDEHVGNLQRVNTVLDWMRRPADIRPRFVTLYFESVDTAGHRHAAGSAELDAAIANVDAAIGRLVAGLAAMDRPANIVVVSDHGMAAVSPERVVQLDELIERAAYVAVDTGPFAAIEPAVGTDERVFDALLRPHEHMQCWRKADIPPHFRYGTHARVAAIFCLAENGWSILSGPAEYPLAGGSHGWDNQWDEMRALFIAAGPSIGQGAHQPFDNVDVYPLLARLIGVAPLASDGDAATLAGIVRR
ncbi:MAG: alkaline phosphatase family protein [Sphingomonadales bacterium]|nr:alkaline phosphatase family protein [Sphingomonadales bacterium]